MPLTLATLETPTPTTTITLPTDLDWSNEFEWNQVEQSQDRTLSGAVIIQEGLKTYGRDIDLIGGQDGAWVSRATVQALRLLEAEIGKVMLLTLPDNSTHHVQFNRTKGPAIEARQVMRLANPGDDHWYTLTLRLITVAPPA